MKKLIAMLCLTALILSMTTLGSLSASAAECWTDEGQPIKDHAYTFVFVGDTQSMTERDLNSNSR